MIVNWLLTRRCNRHCPFCGLVNDSKCEKYKKIKDINTRELPWQDFYIALVKMNEVYNKNNLFHIFYGGEPFLKEGFKDFIKKVNELDVYYTVITNAVLLDEVIKVYEYAGKYKGLTCSLDPTIMKEGDPFNNIKNNAALKLLEANRKNPMTDDMTIECVLDKTNIDYTIPFLNFMAKEFPNVSISISVYDRPQNEYYDFAANPNTDNDYIDSMLLSPYDGKVKAIFNLIRLGSESEKYNIHLGNVTDFIETVRATCNGTFKCNPAYIYEDPVSFPTLTIDADGEFRLCLRIAGTVNMYINDVFYGTVNEMKLKLKELGKQLLINYDQHCEGCAWTCPMMDMYGTNQDISHLDEEPDYE